jgi:small-conductance mechanosensitive channel
VELWERAAVALVVVIAAGIAARLADRAVARRQLAPEAVTRYRVLRRALTTGIMFVGILSALLVIPQVRAIAGGLLASTAVVGLVVGFAAQRTLGNAIAGLLIAITQPLRLGDQVEVADHSGVVEEIGLTFTTIRLEDESRLVVPNERLASDTIRNSTIVSREKVAEITLQVPLSEELTRVVEALWHEIEDEPWADVFVSSLADEATITMRTRAVDEAAAERVAAELRLRAHERLRGDGIYT